MNTNLENLIRDMVTSVDPYAESVENGDQFVGSLIDIARAARSYSDEAICTLSNSIQASYR